ncbi:MAG: cadmium-translocating P-type ATPase [Geobacteraceae bacterium]|nr:cadmium-translocating P-type ATPase [Geobacteraceae bacterium]
MQPAESAEVCFHCGAGIPHGMTVTEERDGETRIFCCPGCRCAWLLITGAGLGEFYSRRDWQEPGIGADAFRAEYHDAQLARFVYPHGAMSAIDVIIEGIRCATCVWLNERIIGRLPGVREVRVNYATGRARVLFEPEEITPAAIFTRIGELGYLPRPYTRSAAEESASRERRDLLVRFGTAFFLTMQLMAYSFALYAGYFQGIGAEIKSSLQLFSWLVTTPVIFYAGWPFLRGAWRGIANRAPNMELLIAIGALSSYGYSIYATFAGGEVYYETAAMIVTLILAGRLLENMAKRRATRGVERLLSLTAGEARRFAGESVETVDVAELRTGDLVLVGPGERFPVDGRIIEGTTDVDESPATGEPLPVEKGAGDRLIAGSINLTGAVRIVCDSPAADSFIARVARLVEEAQSRRAPIQGVADRAAAFFVPAVLLLASATFFWQYVLLGQLGAPLMTALAVVVIACPCALGLATPTAILAGTGAAAAAGVIFKGGDILERLSRVSVAVFDKTGTVTSGKPAVLEVRPAPGLDPRELMAMAAAVESGSLHPIGRAVCDYARENEIAFRVGEGLTTVAGGGVTGMVGEQLVAVGSARFLTGFGVTGVPAETDPPPGGTVIYLVAAGRYAGSVLLQDRLRDDAPALIASFGRSGVRSILLSGDSAATVRLAAGSLGIGEGVGEMSPAEKARFIEELRGRGETVLMVGDGINDAPALSAADVGCAIAGGTDIALETSDLVLARADLERLALAHRMARRTMAVVRQNLGWAFIYNMVGIPLAMTGRLTPVYAAAAMALSSLCVVGNSLRITGVRRG